MKMTMNRDILHVSTMGRSVEFKKGVPIHVPPKMVKEIIALGGTVSEEQDQVEVKAVLAEIQKDADDAEARAPAINEAIRAMVERNQRGDMTAGGRPNLNVLAKLTGFTVSSQELEPLWLAIVAEMA